MNCGYATYTEDNDWASDYVVCQYYPAANMAGAYVANVQPLDGEGGETESAASASFNSATVIGLLTAALMRLMA